MEGIHRAQILLRSLIQARRGRPDRGKSRSLTTTLSQQSHQKLVRFALANASTVRPATGQTGCIVEPQVPTVDAGLPSQWLRFRLVESRVAEMHPHCVYRRRGQKIDGSCLVDAAGVVTSNGYRGALRCAQLPTATRCMSRLLNIEFVAIAMGSTD
jgi:hypothetical protein